MEILELSEIADERDWTGLIRLVGHKIMSIQLYTHLVADHYSRLHLQSSIINLEINMHIPPFTYLVNEYSPRGCGLDSDRGRLALTSSHSTTTGGYTRPSMEHRRSSEFLTS